MRRACSRLIVGTRLIRPLCQSPPTHVAPRGSPTRPPPRRGAGPATEGDGPRRRDVRTSGGCGPQDATASDSGARSSSCSPSAGEVPFRSRRSTP
ncbi:hypothetical protein [Ornithinimicrobium kibberense]|uniref:hypothetical protein n=1 Tax=Ornithinimicrobium kibberense TaxID=282060 RepID=UPI00360B7BA2